MFYSFYVREDHRDYLRFLWFSDKQHNQQVSEYRMRVHVFGNGSSLAIANYGLLRTAHIGEAEYGADAKHFVERDFYVDDGLRSVATPAEAIDLIKRT
ncbi:hypothetical protein NXF25_020186 [Crotalus adamanteus]|uniref:Uncharacterized protein n=1 Tax=Crotalus adamanteus TaxID=8729 RepID=A0AAW1B477_CROAD